MNLDEFFKTPLFHERLDDDGRQDTVARGGDCSSAPPPDLATFARRTLKCCLCHRRHVTCYQRPEELGWYCLECVRKEPTVLKLMFDPHLGYRRVEELYCFICGIGRPTYSAFVQHCASKQHRKELQLRCRNYASIGSSLYPVAAEVRDAVVEKLNQDARFRRHYTKEQIGELPELPLFPHWEECERVYRLCASGATSSTNRIASPTAPSDFVRRSASASEPRSATSPEPPQGANCSGGAHSPEHTNCAPYRIVHVNADMDRRDFHTMLNELRSEAIVGFDSEEAPHAFFPVVRQVTSVSPHLLQLSTSHHVWLFSTVTAECWSTVQQLLKVPDSAKSNAGATTAAAPVQPVSSHIPDEVARQAVDFILDASAEVPELPKSTQGAVDETPGPDAVNVFQEYRRFVYRRAITSLPSAANSPMPSVALPSTTHVGMPSPRPQTKRDGGRNTGLAGERVLPQFLVDFLCRKDVALVGFGLHQDVDQVRSLLGVSGVQWTGANCVDLGRCFSTDMGSPAVDDAQTNIENGTGEASGSESHSWSSTTPAVITPSSHMSQAVGTVQAAARVFHRKFVKPKWLSRSNWSAPSHLLSHHQVLYAARDAVLPLFVVRALLGWDRWK